MNWETSESQHNSVFVYRAISNARRIDITRRRNIYLSFNWVLFGLEGECLGGKVHGNAYIVSSFTLVTNCGIETSNGRKGSFINGRRNQCMIDLQILYSFWYSYSHILITEYVYASPWIAKRIELCHYRNVSKTNDVKENICDDELPPPKWSSIPQSLTMIYIYIYTLKKIQKTERQ